MDAKFQPAIAAIKSGDVHRLRALITADPTLATSRSSTSHPTLLQCVVLQGESAPSVHNLRIAAGLGRMDLMNAFFADNGSLRPEAGTVNWPWGDLSVIERSNHDRAAKDMLAAKFASFPQDRQGIIDNAFVYACIHGHIAAAKLLLERGAQINTIPGGFDYSGTGLHYAALNGQRAMVEWLIEQGADVTVQDTKVFKTPAGWAEYGGYRELKEVLRRSLDQ